MKARRLRNNFKTKKSKMLIYIIPGLLIIYSVFVFWGYFSFIPRAKSSFQRVIPNANNPDFVYIIEMNFVSIGSFIAGKPIDVEVKAFFNYKNPKNSKIKWNEVEIAIGGQECYIYKDKETGKENVFQMVKLTNFDDPHIFSAKETVIFEQAGVQPIFSLLSVNGEPVVKNSGRTISIEERSVWLTVVQNRIILSLTIIALAFTLFQILQEYFK